jgi:hypothetical protein
MADGSGAAESAKGSTASGPPSSPSGLLSRFAQRLLDELRGIALPADLGSEADLEQRVVIPLAVRLAADEPAVRISSTPSKAAGVVSRIAPRQPSWRATKVAGV